MPAAGTIKIVVIEFVKGVEFDGSVLADGFTRHQLADIGIATPAGAQDSCAKGDVFDILFV